MIIQALQCAPEDVAGYISMHSFLDEIDGSGGCGLTVTVTRGDDYHSPSVSFAAFDQMDDNHAIFDFETKRWTL